MFTLPELNYKYDELEPYIDAQTMEIHHSKHQGTAKCLILLLHPSVDYPDLVWK